MANELIIQTSADKYKIVLLKRGRIIEYHEEVKDRPFKVGDIYVAKVEDFSSNLNAALIELGHKKAGFLHYLDLGFHFDVLNKLVDSYLNGKTAPLKLEEMKLPEPISKTGKIEEILKKGQKLLVQITKETIHTKGLRLSGELLLVGQYMLLTPLGNRINISKKITDKEERERLRRLIRSIKPSNFSVTVRTAAAKQEVANLDRELKSLIGKFNSALAQIKKSPVGTRVVEEVNRVSSILRDLLHEEFNQILVDCPLLLEVIKSYIEDNSPGKEHIVQRYEGKTPLLEHLGLDYELKRLFAPIVSIEGGGHLVIEETEGMHVIDVNSGRQKTTKQDRTATPLDVNLAAIPEIFRQIRARPLGGNIVIDFIGMEDPKHREIINQTVKSYLKEDPATMKALPLSEFGLMEITRKRIRPATRIVEGEICPYCQGEGKIEFSLLVISWLEAHIKALAVNYPGTIKLLVHPFLYAYLNQGFLSLKWRWRWKYKKWFQLQADPSIPFTTYKLVNKQGEVLLTRPYLRPKKKLEQH